MKRDRPCSLPLAAVTAQAGPGDAHPRALLATFDDATVTVWQAHSHSVADEAVRTNGFGGSSWRTDRMTRFRLSLPSLLYRNGWATRKDRERILAVRVARSGFDALLRQAVHAAMEADCYATRAAWALATRFANVTLAWHPDVDPSGRALPRETVRIGVRDAALVRFTREWVVAVEDWTDWVVAHRGKVTDDLPVPAVDAYPLPERDRLRIAGRKG